MTTPRHISLTPEQTKQVEACVRSGQYQNASDVVDAGLRLLKEREQLKQRLREGIQQGIDELDAGLGLDADSVFEELREQNANRPTDQAKSA